MATVVTPAQAAEPIPFDASGNRFWSGNLCIDGSGINNSYYPVPYLAQQWNLRVGDKNILALQYEDDCVAKGYPPSRRMVIGKYNNPDDSRCEIWANEAYFDLHNGMRRWTNSPGIYFNVSNVDCLGSQVKREHEISQAIGELLGLSVLHADLYQNRVMSETYVARTSVRVADAASAKTVKEIYQGKYGG
jgi:hypothetical protein